MKYDARSGGIIELPANKYVTSAMLEKLKKSYPKIETELSGTGAKISVQYLTPEEQLNLVVDIKFFAQNPYIPLEDLCASLDNYYPENDSQQELLRYSRSLLELNSLERAAGLFIYGEPGIGKTHIATATAKEFMKRGLAPNYMSTSDTTKIMEVSTGQGLAPGQVWIVDDLNSPYGIPIAAFKRIVLNAHNYGGIVFATSNTYYFDLMENAFVAEEQERDRYMDRTKGMFKVLKVTGTSHREREAWHRVSEEFDATKPETW